jgi:hypothetical protein
MGSGNGFCNLHVTKINSRHVYISASRSILQWRAQRNTQKHECVERNLNDQPQCTLLQMPTAIAWEQTTQHMFVHPIISARLSGMAICFMQT